MSSDPPSSRRPPAAPPSDSPRSDDAQGAAHRPTSRLARFARLSSLTAGVAARHLGQKVASAFQSEEEAAAAERRELSRSAQSIAATFGELKGAAMKIGQMLSTDSEFLPPEITDALSTLQKDAPPMAYSMVRQVVEEALGGALEDFFSAFSEQPIGAASIGQVHRATTRDGQEVAVKVQYPGIADTLESDLRNFASLLNLTRVRLPRERVDSYLEEVTEVLQRESDYLHEADTLERFQTVLRDVPGVRVPVPLYELTRKNVLTMEYIAGERLTSWLERQSDEKRTRIATRLIDAYVEMVHTHGALHADPHPGNFLVDADENVVVLDLGCVRDYDLDFADGLIGILSAMWSHDLERMQAAWRRLGFRDDQLDPEMIYEWLQIALEPLLVDRPFDFAAWRVQESAMHFIKRHPRILEFTPPREALFYLRVLGGLRGIFATAGVHINAYRLSREAVRARALG